MSTHFGDTVERVANFYGKELTLKEIRYSILIRTGEKDTSNNDFKIRYHLKRIGYKSNKPIWSKE